MPVAPTICNLPIDLLTEVISFLPSLDSIVKLARVNKYLYYTLFCDPSAEKILYRVLCNRDHFNHRMPMRGIGLRQLYFSFEQDIGESSAIWFLRFNPESLTWELNPSAVSTISNLKRKERQIAIITALDMDEPSNESASSVLNTLLGIENAFPTRSEMLADKSYSQEAHLPGIYMWSKPYIFHSNTRAQISKNKSSKKKLLAPEDEVEPDIKDIIFLRAYGLFDTEANDFSHDDSISSLRKALTNFILLLSSTVIICKHEKNQKWVQQLDQLLDTVNEPPLFGTQEDRRSLLVCTRRDQDDDEIESKNGNNNKNSTSVDFKKIAAEERGEQLLLPLMHAYDLLNEIRPFVKNYPRHYYMEDLPYISCMINWFGKVHAFYYSPQQEQQFENVNSSTSSLTKRETLQFYEKNHFELFNSSSSSTSSELAFRSDIWSFVNDLALTLNFGWPLGRWSRVKPYGDVCAKYIEHLVNEANKKPNRSISVNGYDKIMSKFGREFLNAEIQAATEFYRRAVHEELNKAVPLEMDELVKFSEMHADSALRTFTQSVSPALFCHQVVDDMERNLKQAINAHFRPLWRENGENSENYCQSIFDSCFKWAKAEYDCPSKPSNDFKNSFIQNFINSLKVYLANAKGTKKYQVMSFSCKQYFDLILSVYPDLKSACDKIHMYVEHTTMQGTVEMDKERSYLQRLSSLKLKLITLDNSLQRLKEEITARQLQAEKSELYQLVVENKLENLNIKCKNKKKWSSVRALFVDSCKFTIETELERKRETEQQIVELKQEWQAILDQKNNPPRKTKSSAISSLLKKSIGKSK